MPQMVIFDDGRGLLGPMTDLRASFEVRTGVLTTAARIESTSPWKLAAYWVPDRLKTIIAERSNVPVNELPADEDFICVNGRWLTPESSISLNTSQAVIEETTLDVIIAHLNRDDALAFLATGNLSSEIQTESLPVNTLCRYAWQVITALKKTILNDLETIHLVDAQVPSDCAAIIGDHPIEIHKSAKIYPTVVLDSEHGAICIDESAVIRPGAIICGPCAIGRKSVVVDRALIKPFTAVGPFCKVAGEIGSTIFQGHSNKAHDGHLGDSWVGEWANLGAGTTNSNILNTYGDVKMQLQPDGERLSTGMQFLGTIVGDHAKLGINSRIMTGTVIGTGAMISRIVPPLYTNAFSWLTDNSDQVFRFDKFIEVARQVMSRRDVTPSEAYLALLRDLHTSVRSN